MKRIIYTKLLSFLALIFIFASCQEESGPQPLEFNSIPPGQVANIQIDNLNGKVNLKYTLPSDTDLLYVKAVYNLENGTPMEVKSSYYNNSMVLEGFRGLQDVKVKLYSVNRSEVASKPLEITVSPKESPIFDIARSLDLSDDFSGVHVKATNKDKINVAILIMKKNALGDFEPLSNSVYTSAEKIEKSVRGFDVTPTPIAVVVRDRWLNVSDTIFKTVNPYYETVIPTSGYQALKLDNDPDHYEEFCCNRIPLSALWDQQYGWPRAIVTVRDAPDTKLNTVTFDLGKSVLLSRVHIWDFRENSNDNQYFYLGSLRYFKIWGRNAAPSQNGKLDEWTLLGEYEVTKPSGLPVNQTSNEDVLQARAGVSYPIPLGTPKMRYLRIQSTENWGKVKGLAIADLLVYGDPR